MVQIYTFFSFSQRKIAILFVMKLLLKVINFLVRSLLLTKNFHIFAASNQAEKYEY